ncbi:MAG: hypothetical protein J5449_07065 [Oscillospiraceae bacterium]|nr:hypothetical protein [Oscillospiraceae bacterium]
MSNQRTDCFLELLEKAAAGSKMTENQKELIGYLKERREVNLAAPGTASFDVADMPWNKDTLSEDAAYMMQTIKRAKSAEVLSTLDYRPDIRIVYPWLDRFAEMIWKLDKDYLYGVEEKELVNGGIEPIRAVLCGKDGGAKRRLLFCLDRYLDPYYQNDLTAISEPIKGLLQELVLSENEADIIGEALHLLEAYLEPPFDILTENAEKVPEHFLPTIQRLMNQTS